MPHKNFHSYRYAPLYVRSALSEILFPSVKKGKYHQNSDFFDILIQDTNNLLSLSYQTFQHLQ